MTRTNPLSSAHLSRLFLSTFPANRYASQIRIKRTLSKIIDGQLPARALAEMLERDVRLALADHQVHDDEALEDDRPSRVAQAVLQRAEDLGDARLARVRRDQDVLDIFGLRGRELPGGEGWSAGGFDGWMERRGKMG